MINESELRRLIRQEIKQALALVLTSKTTAENTTEDQQLEQIFPGSTVFKDKFPVAHPYGFCSRSPKDKLAVHAQVGEHLGARLIIAHRDEARTSLDIQLGEVCLYDELGNTITLRNAEKKIELQVKEGDRLSLSDKLIELEAKDGDKVSISDKDILLGNAADEPVPLGNVLVELLGNILDKLIAGTMCLVTSPGNPTAPNPAVATEFTNFKAKYLTTATTNIISDHVKVSRSK